MIRCTNCSAEVTPLKKGGFFCEECGARFTVGTSVERPKVEVDLDSLPTFISHALASYRQEANPVLALWHAADLVELTLRLLVIAGVAELRDTGKGVLPAPVVSRLGPLLAEPTLGMWRGMAEILAAQSPDSSAVLPELPGTVSRIVGLLDGNGPKTPECSFAALRNHLAHGAGVSRKYGARLLELWRSRFETFLTSLAWLNEVTIVVATASGPGALRGPTPEPIPLALDPAVAGRVAAALARREDVLLVRGRAMLSLWPLAFFGPSRPPATEHELGTDVLPHVYARRGDVQLQLTPIGSDVCAVSESDDSAFASFVRLFTPQPGPLDQPSHGFTVAGFEREIERDSRRLIGRDAELAALHQAVSETKEGVLWVAGPAGIGKTYLVARLTTETLEHPPAGTFVLAFRFKAGDGRCDRAQFLRFAIERLAAVLPGLSEIGPADREPPLQRLRKLLGALGGHRVLFILDGLDEIAERDRAFAREIPLALRGDGVTWLCAGRPDHGLAEEFNAARCRDVFPTGLPPLTAGDVRAMLLEKIGPLRKRIVSQDRDRGDGATNSFVDRVFAAARGFPIYVTYVIGDVLSNRLRALDAGERLPPTLDKYYEELLRRCSVGVLHQVLTPIVAMIAVAKEPLPVSAIAALLARDNKLPDDENAEALVRRALSMVGSMMRRAETVDGGEGYTLYHHSLRQFMASSADISPALTTARAGLARLTLEPEVRDRAARRYLYRHGISHLEEAGREADASKLLTSFEYLFGRLRELSNPGAVLQVMEEGRRVLGRGSTSGSAVPWLAFFEASTAAMSRADDAWPAHRILVQRALEQPEDEPVGAAANAWLRKGECDWSWLQAVRRPTPSGSSGASKDLRFRATSFDVLSNDRIAAFDLDDPVVRIFDLRNGACIARLEGHTAGVWDVSAVSGDVLATCGKDATVRLWNVAEARCVKVFAGHHGNVYGIRELADGRLLSWSDDKTLRIWRTDGSCNVLSAHSRPVWRAAVVAAGRAVSWSLAHSVAHSEHEQDHVYLWDLDQGRAIGAVHHGADVRVRLLSRRGLVGVSAYEQKRGHTIRVIDPSNGRVVAERNGELWGWRSDGRIVLYRVDDGICAWDCDTGESQQVAQVPSSLRVVMGPKDQIAWFVPPGDATGSREFFYSDVRTGTTLRFRGHTAPVSGVLFLDGDRLLSCSEDGTIRLWSTHDETCLVPLVGHRGRVSSLARLDGNRVLSFGEDTTRLWDLSVPHSSHSQQHGPPVHTEQADWSGLDRLVPRRGTRPIRAGGTRAASYGDDGAILVWDAVTGIRERSMRRRSPVVGAIARLPDRLIAAYHDGTVVTWDVDTGEAIATAAAPRGVNLHEFVQISDDEALTVSYSQVALDIWDLASGEHLAHVGKRHHTFLAEKIPFAILGAGSVVARLSKGIWVWDGPARRATWLVENNEALAVAPLGPNGFVSSHEDGVIRFWRRWELEREVPGVGRIHELALCGDFIVGAVNLSRELVALSRSGEVAGRSSIPSGIRWVANLKPLPTDQVAATLSLNNGSRGAHYTVMRWDIVRGQAHTLERPFGEPPGILRAADGHLVTHHRLTDWRARSQHAISIWAPDSGALVQDTAESTAAAEPPAWWPEWRKAVYGDEPILARTEGSRVVLSRNPPCTGTIAEWHADEALGPVIKLAPDRWGVTSSDGRVHILRLRDCGGRLE